MYKKALVLSPRVAAPMAILALAGSVNAAVLEEVIVTAQKRAENLQDVPITLTAFDGEALDKFGITDTRSLEATTPGLISSKTTSTGQSFWLRGIGSRFAFAGQDPSTAVYMDDRYIGRSNAIFFDFADVERVEVLKGPQGILYGRNATAGAIRVISKDVGEEFERELNTGLGNYGARRVSGTVNVPVSDTFGFRFTMLDKERDGFALNLDPRGRNELDDLNTSAYRTKFRWDITEDVTSKLTVGYRESDDTQGSDIVDRTPPYGINAGVAAGGISSTEPRYVATAGDGSVDVEEIDVSLRFDVAFDRVDFASITTYDKFKMYADNGDADGTSARLFDGVDQTIDVDSYSQEFQLISSLDGNWNWLAGAFFYVEDINQFQINLDLRDGPAGRFGSQGNTAVKTTASAIYGQATYEFTDAWALTLGGRYTIEEKEAEVNAPGGNYLPLGHTFPFNDEEEWKEFTPKVSLEYSFEQGMAYLTFSRGFKSGAFDYPASKVNAITGQAVDTLDPEILDMVELGWKTELLDSSVRFNGAIYYYDYSDLQVTRAATDPNTGSVVNLIENAADATVMGAEFDLVWQVNDALRLRMGANYNDSEYENYIAVGNILNSIVTGNPNAAGARSVPGYDADGKKMLRSPSFSGFVSAEYDFYVPGGTLPVMVNYSYKSEYDFDFVVDPDMRNLTQDGYGLVNANIAYIPDGEQWKLSVWGNNLTDEEYFDDLVVNGAGIRGSYADPRTYGFDIQYRF
ncbi:MAG: TonB-dependent receptor [Porticoccaceae bacterium]|nr:TonB-dependent receptor [Porticoccaceae bacterium]